MKSVLKLALGVAVLLVAAFVFFRTQSSGSFDKGSLKHWLASSNEQRIATVKIAVAGEGDIDLIVACVNKIATLPDSNEMDTQTAITLCHTGNLLKENI
ncbi:MAG: hypothetical protein J6W79_01710 [Alphaproteobacteria bacterium]|nr:hypothetical protein [Alphaproteobacteria bacterium]